MSPTDPVPDPLDSDDLEEARETLRRTCRFLTDYGSRGPGVREDPGELAQLLQGVLDKLKGVEKDGDCDRRDSEPPLAA